MLRQESVGAAAAAPLDVNPYWLTNHNGSRNSQDSLDLHIDPLPQPQPQANGEGNSEAPSAEAQVVAVPSEAEAAAIEHLSLSSKSLYVSKGSLRQAINESMAQQEGVVAAPVDVDPHTEAQLQSNHTGSSAVPPSTERPPSMSETIAAVNELRTRMVHTYQPLYQAAIRGDWKSAKSFVGQDTNLWKARITFNGETVLIIATRVRQWQFAEKLIEILPSEALAMQDIDGLTALHYVAVGGSLSTAKALIRKNSALPQITTKGGDIPLISALASPKKEMVWYLTSLTRDLLPRPSYPFTSSMPSCTVVYMLTVAGYIDITMYMLQRFPELAIAEVDRKGFHPLIWLILNPSVFPSQSRFTIWERLIYKFVHVKIAYAPPNSQTLDVKSSMGDMEGPAEMVASIKSKSFPLVAVFHCFKMLPWKAAKKLVPSLEQVREAKLQHICANQLVEHICTQLASNMNFEQALDYLKDIMFSATRFGIVEIVKTCILHFPDLTFIPQLDKKSVLEFAIICRQDKIFNLIKEIEPSISLISLIYQDDAKNTIWHLVANLAPPSPLHSAPSSSLSSAPGAALQMQRELQWFKEVEKIICPVFKMVKNSANQTAKDVFKEKHKDLAEKGEKWMKDTSNSCMVVSTLITTVVFAAAFTVPGGNVSDKGVPIFLRENLFIVFAISDALALLSSSTSLLMFLSILTARYEQEDFLHSLPKRLIIGLGSLFFAIITMMVAFAATLFLALEERWHWVSVPIILMASIPVTIFVMLQLPLFIQMARSTYGSGIFVKTR